MGGYGGGVDDRGALMAGLRDVVFDAHHALNLARFWDAVLDSHALPALDDELMTWLTEQGIDPDNPPSVGLDPVGGSGGMRIFFNNVPDPTPGKNRVHIDLNLRDDAELQRVLNLGATVVSRPEERGERWWILADPEGNQFCAFPPE
jgi:predicted enzyme related to lactoylglutathione lyase